MTQHRTPFARNPILRWLRTDRRSAVLVALAIPMGLSHFAAEGTTPDTQEEPATDTQNATESATHDSADAGPTLE
jgi:hypothetical protein